MTHEIVSSFINLSAQPPTHQSPTDGNPKYHRNKTGSNSIFFIVSKIIFLSVQKTTIFLALGSDVCVITFPLRLRLSFTAVSFIISFVGRPHSHKPGVDKPNILILDSLFCWLFHHHHKKSYARHRRKSRVKRASDTWVLVWEPKNIKNKTILRKKKIVL